MKKSNSKIKKIFVIFIAVIAIALLCSLSALIIGNLNAGSNPGTVTPGYSGEIILSEENVVF